jgi:hypothetical protein
MALEAWSNWSRVLGPSLSSPQVTSRNPGKNQSLRVDLEEHGQVVKDYSS